MHTKVKQKPHFQNLIAVYCWKKLGYFNAQSRHGNKAQGDIHNAPQSDVGIGHIF